jgi:hypothetical protein
MQMCRFQIANVQMMNDTVALSYLAITFLQKNFLSS